LAARSVALDEAHEAFVGGAGALLGLAGDLGGGELGLFRDVGFGDLVGIFRDVY